MSRHSYTRCWHHLVWATQDRRPLLDHESRMSIAETLKGIGEQHDIYMKMVYVNADHVHALVDQPPNRALDETAKLLKGASSHWINEQRLCMEPFAWQRGYAAFSVSPSRLDAVCRYIAGQEEHHRKVSVDEEMQKLLAGYGLVWKRDEEGNE